MRKLYPDIQPYATQRLAVDSLHVLHVEECGNPEGVPVLLVHGAADPVVPFAAMDAAAQDLARVGIEVEAHRRPGVGHGIDPTGLELAGKFLARILANK